ncbi:MAG: cytochrome C biogenesis protein ResB [Geobacter sp.]|nr:MAG: cytochrome C biogenesis protein ResB [Geobacter sp.]
MYSKFMKFLSSLRFTLLLISLLGVMFLAGLWIPQRSLLTQAMYNQWKHNSPSLVAFFEALGFTSIYASPLMLILWCLFFINLALVMWQRIPLIKKRIALPEGQPGNPESAPGYPFHATYHLPAGMDGTTILSLLRKRGFAVIGDSNGFCGVKNRFSPIAFGLFHISFFLILLGGMISVYTRFTGLIDLAEGESFQGETVRYNASPQMPKIGPPPRVSFTVKSILPTLTSGVPTGLKVRMVDGRGVEHEADVNRPYKTDNSSFIVSTVGPAPLFVVQDRSGKEIDGAYMKLNVMGGKEDVFSLAGYQFRATFYPDYYLKNGAPASHSPEFKNPVFMITVERQGKAVTTGTVTKGGSLGFDDYQLMLKELPYWVRFSVFKERGLFIIYAGFALASLAVVWRFLFYRREVVGIVREEEGESLLVVAGRSEFYKSLTEDEFTAMFNKLLDTDGRTDT